MEETESKVLRRKELREKFDVAVDSGLIVTENGTVLMAYFEDVLDEADELVKEVFDLFSKYSSATDEETAIVRKKYDSLFEKTRWTFIEVPLVDEE
ncbi:hypothetical protein JQC73_03215 [Enterococcus durans]|uniref:hypothetical protein n=1 Tax=Enterococcus durans TaxID=53345 RepID=UPI00193BAD21|nr:hypothetical protein [Enterococcus durans]MBM1151954.1 hypothetical protein [Enterococcus durans]